LNDRDVVVLVDTGAASTVFNLELGRALGLELRKSSHHGGGAGAARLDIYYAPNAHLRLGEFERESRR
jgi:Aspartyl protease